MHCVYGACGDNDMSTCHACHVELSCMCMHVKCMLLINHMHAYRCRNIKPPPPPPGMSSQGIIPKLISSWSAGMATPGVASTRLPLPCIVSIGVEAGVRTVSCSVLFALALSTFMLVIACFLTDALPSVE